MAYRGGSVAPPWLYGRLERKEVDEVFSSFGNQEGAYLVRESTRNVGDYVLSVIGGGKVQHYIIVNSGGRFNIDDGPEFNSLAELISFYEETSERLPCVLLTPCNRPGTQNSTPSRPPPRGSSDAPPLPPASHRGGSTSDAPPLPPAIRRGSSEDSAPPPVPPAAHRGSSGAAPPPLPSSRSSQDTFATQNMRNSLDESPSARGGSTRRAPPPLPTEPAGPSSQSSVRSPGPSSAPAQTATLKRGQMAMPEARTNLAEVPRVKKWIDAAATIENQQIEVQKEEMDRRLPEGFTADSVRTAAMRQEAFEQAALQEEKMYLLWLNKQLKSLGKPQVNDISQSLLDGTLIIDVLKNPPMYAKRVTVLQQEIDNWQVIVKWMRKLGIQVDNPPDSKETENIGLDAVRM